MKIGLIAIAAMLAVGLVGFDGALESFGAEGALTENAAAVCVEDPLTGGCLPLCPPNPLRDEEKLPVGVHYDCLM